MALTLGPVTGVELYRRDAVVVRSSVRSCHPHTIPARGVITHLSRRSRQRLAFVANNTYVDFRSMITLTYPRQFPNDGKGVKRNLNAFLTWLRRKQNNASYLWFLEFQKRGAPHIHILLSCSLERQFYTQVSEQWYKTVGSNDPLHLRAGTRCEAIRKRDGAARYALKYAYKCEQKLVPEAYQNVGRFWGCSRDVKPQEAITIPIDDMSLRDVLADWTYRQKAHRPLWHILYGCSERIQNHPYVRAWLTLELSPTFDTPAELVYACAQHKQVGTAP
jgi:hypothetical protein